tara:strand:- start:927 stop:1967 length:1041 start_codon:yes stop_codon:yes gene_type:complete
MHSIENDLVEEYSDSFLMGRNIELKTISNKPTNNDANVISSSFLPFFTQYISLRIDSILVDTLIRNNPLACAPHMNNQFHEVNPRNSEKWDYSKKWSLSQKLYANLSETIVYICERCFIFGNFEFAILPISVSSSQSEVADHKNMLVFHYKRDKKNVEILLFEPNGEMYGRTKTKYIVFLKAVVTYSNKILEKLEKKYSINTPVLVGGEGIQNFLGIEEVTEMGTRLIGLPICSLVTYWTITKWISSGMKSNSFEEFTKILIEKIKVNRKEKQKEVYEFIKEFNGDISKIFSKKLQDYIDKDKPLIIEKYSKHIHKTVINFYLIVSVISKKYYYVLSFKFDFTTRK